MGLALEKFPLLRAAARSPSRFEVAVERVLAGIEAGSIRNVDYQDVKYEVGQAAADAWNNHVASPFFHGGKWEKLPLDVNELYDSIMILSLHDVIATAKKVARSKAQGPSLMRCGPSAPRRCRWPRLWHPSRARWSRAVRRAQARRSR